MLDDILWLQSHHFEHVGHWSRASNKLQRYVDIQRVPGIYAFAVDGTLCYIGKATRLRSRLRGYNRSLGPELETRPFRKAHKGISEKIAGDESVDVWVYYHAHLLLPLKHRTRLPCLIARR
jgi:hypothetical protein